jgi:lipid-A-disaccharide synthase-like uncharacterized protein
MMNNETFWMGVGFFGQAMFSSRFLVQWLKSEIAGRSVMPVAFWYLSIAGGVCLLVYAVYRKDPVFIVGNGVGLFVYLRNLYLIMRERHQRGLEEGA